MGDLALSEYLGRKGITDARVLHAIAELNRRDFMPTEVQPFADEDAPAPIGHGQTISQPYVVAFMSQELDVQPGMKVLEIGTGSGYQAAVLAKLGANVYSIERIPELLSAARAAFNRLDLAIQTRLDDGSRGWPEQAPFDRIIVTAAAARAPTRLIQQLATPGRLIAPVGDQESNQQLMLIDRSATGHLDWRSILPVRFVPLIESDGTPRA
ncbi:MAG: protein-L-isoaspartate(D-aspartate) O-methyltransferase [Myxococcaceae bacterium]